LFNSSPSRFSHEHAPKESHVLRVGGNSNLLILPTEPASFKDIHERDPHQMSSNGVEIHAI